MIGRWMLGVAVFVTAAASPAQEIRQYLANISRVEDVGQYTRGTACTDARGDAGQEKKVAALLATSALVKSRDGSSISGLERMSDGVYRQVIYQDVLGITKPIRILEAFEAVDGQKVLLCVTVEVERHAR